MKKYVGLLIVLLLFPFIVLAIDEETMNYEQDIVEAYEQEVEKEEETSSSDGEVVTYGYDQGEEIVWPYAYEYTNEETKYNLYIYDGADLLSSEQEEKLKNEMMPLTKYGNIAFLSTKLNSSTTAYYADKYYHDLFGTQSGTLFLIDMDNREIYIFSDGENYKTITRSKAYLITDNTYRKATAGLYYACASEAYKEIYDLLEGRKIMEPMRHITNGLISITLGFFGVFIFMINKTKIPKATARQRLKYSRNNFKMGEISVKKVGESKKYCPPSSSSGGGSSGGGSSGGGGGSSGGGGGHSF